MPGFSKPPVYFSYIFLDNTTHIFWDQYPSLIINVVASIWDSFLVRALVLLLFQYTASLSGRGRGLVYFDKVNYSRICRIFSWNWLGLNILCEILWVLNFTSNWRFWLFRSKCQKEFLHIKQNRWTSPLNSSCSNQSRY